MFKYITFIDCDEFMFCNSSSVFDFADRLLYNSKNGGIGGNWIVFGFLGLDEKPESCVTDNSLCRAEDDFEANHLIKSICNPRRILGFADPHRPYSKRGYTNLDEDGMPIVGPVSDTVKYKYIRINHYFTKSKREYLEKIDRGKAALTNFRDMGDFIKHDKNDVYDYEIVRWKRRLSEHDGKGRETIKY